MGPGSLLRLRRPLIWGLEDGQVWSNTFVNIETVVISLPRSSGVLAIDLFGLNRAEICR